MALLTGTDVQQVSAVARILADPALAGRYVARLHTAAEVAAAGWPGDPSRVARRLARGYAAKEAVLKALAPAADEVPGWRDIEVVEEGRTAGVRLHGAAAALAEARGVRSWQLSITACADLAVAIVIACR